MSWDLRVRLAGFNIDRTVLSGRGVASPETLSAAYARVSRSPKSLEELRKDAILDVQSARRSNTRIVFDMGHASVAEHAVLNFDIEGLSRLALEELESHRLASYTERSQRYVKFSKDYVVPEGLGAEEEGLFRVLCDELFATYQELTEALTSWHINRGRKERTARLKAMEDARYVLPLATRSQVGMTVNARQLEYMTRRMLASPLREVQELARLLIEQAMEVIPSLVRYVEPSSYDRLTLNPNLEETPFIDTNFDIEKDFEIIWKDSEGEGRILSALLLKATGRYVPPSKAVELPEVKGLVKELFTLMGPHDPAPREFEHARVSFTAVVSASAYAQLKRHRLMSITAGPYMEELGWSIPPAIEEAGLAERFEEVRGKEKERAKGSSNEGRAYLFTNAHRKRVLVSVNLRELYHFFRLRMDRHAQWEIRGLAKRLGEGIRRLFPLTGALVAGKDSFERVKEGFLNPPKDEV